MGSKDITEHKKVEEREEFLHSLLRHDVRNKAQIVEGYLELLEDYDLPEEAAKYVEKAERATREGGEIIEKVRTLRKAQKEQVGEVDITSAIHDATKQVENMVEEAGMKIEMQCPGEGCIVKGGSLVNKVFSNLMENSIRHSDGSRLRIRGEATEKEVTCIIEDDGKGVPDGVKDKIFDRGFKKGEKAGSGLGMYLAKEIAESYGGSIEVKDSELGGAKFVVHLKRVHV